MRATPGLCICVLHWTSAVVHPYAHAEAADSARVAQSVAQSVANSLRGHCGVEYEGRGGRKLGDFWESTKSAYEGVKPVATTIGSGIRRAFSFVVGFVERNVLGWEKEAIAPTDAPAATSMSSFLSADAAEVDMGARRLLRRLEGAATGSTVGALVGIGLLVGASVATAGGVGVYVGLKAQKKNVQLVSVSEEEEGARKFFESQSGRAIGRRRSADTDESDESSTSDSSASSTLTALGARAFHMQIPDTEIQQKVLQDIAGKDSSSRPLMNKLSKVVDVLARTGVDLKKCEDTSTHFLVFHGVKRSDVLVLAAKGKGRTTPRSSNGDDALQSPGADAAAAVTTSTRSSPVSKETHHSVSVLSNRPIPTQEESYLEIEVQSLDPGACVAVGVSPKVYPAYRLPGLDIGSIAYNSADGNLHRADSVFGLEGGQPYGAKDFIGLLVKRTGDLATECLFYKNGQLQTFACIPKEWEHPLHICIGATGGARVVVNFGTAPSRYPPFVRNEAAANLPFGSSPLLSKPSKRRVSPVGTPTATLPDEEDFDSPYGNVMNMGMMSEYAITEFDVGRAKIKKGGTRDFEDMEASTTVSSFMVSNSNEGSLLMEDGAASDHVGSPSAANAPANEKLSLGVATGDDDGHRTPRSFSHGGR